jgi:hypothetical protein
LIVSNASPLINISAIRKLDLLRKLYKQILIPAAVWDEIVIKGKGQPGSEAVRKANWIKKEPVQNVTLVETLGLTLDRGEAEAIALAKEKNAELLLIDEQLAKKVADHLSLNYIGLIGVLREAKSKGLIKGIKSHMDLLRTVAGFWISEDVYREILKLEDENELPRRKQRGIKNFKFCHSALDAESSPVFWIPASAGMTNSPQTAGNTTRRDLIPPI